jgi:hypothetical protein
MPIQNPPAVHHKEANIKGNPGPVNTPEKEKTKKK